MGQRLVGSRTPGPSDTQVLSRAGGASGGLPATPPTPLIHNRVQVPVLSCAPEPQPARDPHSLPQLEGDSPKAWGEGTPVYCFSSSFLSRKNSCIVLVKNSFAVFKNAKVSGLNRVIFFPCRRCPEVGNQSCLVVADINFLGVCLSAP